jgi:hypothetical protein
MAESTCPPQVGFAWRNFKPMPGEIAAIGPAVLKSPPPSLRTTTERVEAVEGLRSRGERKLVPGSARASENAHQAGHQAADRSRYPCLFKESERGQVRGDRWNGLLPGGEEIRGSQPYLIYRRFRVGGISTKA